MTSKSLAQVLATLLLLAVGASASAISVTSDQSGANINVGDQITLIITGEFSDDPTLGGGLNFNWDPAVLALISFDPMDWGGDPDFFGAGIVTAFAGTITSFAAGNFDGVSGPVTMATITFEAVGPGRTLTLSDDFGGPAGRFTSAVTFDPQTVDFGPDNDGGQITVVPLPAAVWFMIAGVGTLLGFRRKT